jgi:hypothetical protein
MVTKSVEHITVLENLVNRGAFETHVEDFIDYLFRNGSADTWYAKIVATQGQEEGERELDEWVKRNHYDTFASSIELTACGIIALGKVKSDLVIDITDCETYVYSPIDGHHGPRHKYIVFNEQAPGCGCSQPKGSEVFGPGGELGFQAVIIETGYGYDYNTRSIKPKSSMTLVLPAWGTEQYPVRKGEYVLARFESNGSNHGSRITPCIQIGSERQLFTDVVAHLKHTLGMDPLGDHVSGWEHSSGVDQVVGFPGAEDYLAAHLSDLGDYFTNLADKLDGDHSH